MAVPPKAADDAAIGDSRPLSNVGWRLVDGPEGALIALFATRVLGCNCPSRVFRHIAQSLEPAPASGGVSRRIAIGGRLLIHVIEAATLDDALASIAEWMRVGCGERDRLGLRRLRLVVVLARPCANAQRRLGEAMVAAADGLRLDPSNCHLHCLSRADLPKDW